MFGLIHHFNELPIESLEQISRIARPRNYKAGQVIYIEGEPAESVFLLERGWVKATRALLRRQTQLIRERRENIYNLAFNPVANRLAKLILEKFMKEENSSVQRDLSLGDMAAMIATSPEVICRIMYQFQADGLLSIDRASITVHDQEALEKLLL